MSKNDWKIKIFEFSLIFQCFMIFPGHLSTFLPLKLLKVNSLNKKGLPKKSLGSIGAFLHPLWISKNIFFFQELLLWLLLTTSSILNLLPLTQNMTRDFTLMWTISSINFVKIGRQLVPHKYSQSGQKCLENCNYNEGVVHKLDSTTFYKWNARRMSLNFANCSL